MRRRELVELVVGASVVMPFQADAQQKAMPVIGILDVGDPAPLLKAFGEGLRDKGYVEGQNIRLEIRSPAGSSKVLAELGGKRILPSASRIGILANPAGSFTKPVVGEMQTDAAKLGVEIDPVMVSGAAEFETGFAALRKAAVDCVVIQPSLPQKPAVEMALKVRLPPFGATRQTVER
jgi:putative tryptophan/tyrosine transport system substrate-binding protein